MNTLGVVPSTTSWPGYGRLGRVRETVVDFLDFTVDGVPLRRLVAEDWHDGGVVQDMTCLDESWPTEAVAGLRKLLGTEAADFNDGRVALLTCPIDHDLDCGAVSASIVWHHDTVEWRELGLQVSYAPFSDPLPVPNLRFERRPYVDQLEQLISRFLQIAEQRELEAETKPSRRLFRRRRSTTASPE